MKRKIFREIRQLTNLFSFKLLICKLLLGVLFVYSNSYAQDIYSIYYPSGDNKLLDENKTKLRRFIYSFNIKKLDSLQVIGFADSTGKPKLNEKLSFKRAQKVSKYLTQLLPKGTKIATYGKGEESSMSNATVNHRRVEVHLYIAGRALEDTTEQLEYFGNTKTCFVLSDSIMRNAHVIRVTDGRNNYVILEMEPHLFSKNQTYYTLTKNSNYAKVVKWKLVQSGSGWWRHERYRARVKEVDFESFGILTKKLVPESYNECLVCEKDMNHALKMSTELLPDAFVMQQLQIQKKWSDGTHLLIVPKDYVNLDKTYYYDPNYDQEVYWKTKFGLKNRPYYFAEVPTELLKDPKWNIYTHRDICLLSKDSIAIEYPIDTMTAHACQPESRGGLYALEFGLEAGFWNWNYHSAVLAAFAQYIGTKWEYALHAGIDLKARFQVNAKVDYSFLSFSVFKNKYIGNSNRSTIHDFHRTINAYAGTDFTFGLVPANPVFFQGLYVGAAYKDNPFSLGLDRVFAQVGVSTNYLRHSFAAGLYFRVGVKFKM